MMKRINIPIFFAINDRYAAALSVALASLFQHLNRNYQYSIIVMYQTLSKKNQEKLESFQAENATIQFVSLSASFSEMFVADDNKLRVDFKTLTIYYRLFIADMFPQYDKGIYFDADILILNDISPLFETDLQGNIVGAVNDRFIGTNPIGKQYAAQGVGVQGSQYVNSGVLLMDLNQLRERKFSTIFVRLLQQYHFRAVAPDQDYLNAICKHHILLLSDQWNYQTAMKKIAEYPVRVVHFNLFDKPWHYMDVPYADIFWEFAKNTPYYAELKQALHGYPEDSKQRDLKNSQQLLDFAVEITKDPVTFKDIEISDTGSAVNG